MINYLKNIFSKESDASSKRLFGAIGFVFVHIMIAIWRHDLIGEALYVDAALLTSTLLEKIKK